MKTIRIKNLLKNTDALSKLKMKFSRNLINFTGKIYSRINKKFLAIHEIIRKQNPRIFFGITGALLLLSALIFGFSASNQEKTIVIMTAKKDKSLVVQVAQEKHDDKQIDVNEKPERAEKHEKNEEETPPETFVFLDFFSEMLETSFGGVGVKIAELTPKVQHVNEMYQHGEKHRAFAKALGIATEVVLIGFFVETFGIGEMFISAISFQDNWPLLMGQSMLGVMLSTKVALFLGEQVEEAAEHQYEHDVQIESNARKAHSPENNHGDPHH
ncbi:hypothetical protein CCP3SC5AM1_600012 [Gammaproteobacteria bacterium]